MTMLLFPGRHLLNTTFQAGYLRTILNMPLHQLDFLDGARPATDDPIDRVVFAITSSNQQHSRYNPIPFHVRAIGVDRFARSLELTFSFTYHIVGIPHYRPTPAFAEIILKEIVEQTEGEVRLTPRNCVVLSSTPGIFSLFRRLGFCVLPAEHGAEGTPETPTQLLQKFVAAGAEWRSDPELCQKLADATYDLWADFPGVPRRIRRLWQDPLLDEEGSLTGTRDYASYAFGLSNNEIVRLKYRDIRRAIVPGRIADEGCADGALLARIARDFPDSDLIGIEITGEFLARCHERQRAGQFGGTFVHFHQRNIAEPIFEDKSIDTTICNSTVHELWSYGAGSDTVHAYFAGKYAQTRPGGHLVIRDVVGPPHKEQQVLMQLQHRDGANEDIFADFDDAEALALHLARLSTYARFHRFARDFLPKRRARAKDAAATAFPFRETSIGGERYVLLALRDAVEFMTKKDYLANWRSEMHEEFAFWDFGQWKTALAAAGFHVLENPNTPQLGSRVYTNPWIVKSRWQGKVGLYTRVNGELQQLPYPPTNIVLVGEKRARD